MSKKSSYISSLIKNNRKIFIKQLVFALIITFIIIDHGLTNSTSFIGIILLILSIVSRFRKINVIFTNRMKDWLDAAPLFLIIIGALVLIFVPPSNFDIDIELVADVNKNPLNPENYKNL